ncbi:MAG: glycosyltransferase family 4 protein [Candidatus Omnitrophica bacterium]|nr:glycosyltransferase family 4 protein [Candidatus Omnitrophota bacterium]
MPRVKKIVFLEQYCRISGGQKVLLEIIESLDKSRYKAMVVLPARGQLSELLQAKAVPFKVLPLGFYSLGYKSFFDLINYCARLPVLLFLFALIIKREKPDLVYANGARTFTWATIICHLMKVPLTWHLHSIFDKGFLRIILNFLGRFSVVEKIIAVSKSAAFGFLNLGDKVKIIYNGIDTKKFLPASRDNKNEDSLLISSLGLLVKWKNQEDLVRAAYILSNKGKTNLSFRIIGGPLYESKKGRSYLLKLQKMVKNYGLEERVELTGHRDNVSSLLKKSDIVVITSKEPDPCPLVLLEAMASETAVVASDKGGPAEIINEGEDGLLYRAGNYRQLADKIDYLCENENIRLDIARKASFNCRINFSREVFQKKIKEAIEGCIR